MLNECERILLTKKELELWIKNLTLCLLNLRGQTHTNTFFRSTHLEKVITKQTKKDSHVATMMRLRATTTTRRMSMIFLTAAVCCLVLVVVSGSIHWRTALSLFSDSSPIGLSETHDDGREGRREQRTSHRRAGTSSVVLQDEEEWRASRRKQPQQQLGSLDVDENDATAELRILQKWNVLFQQEAMPLKHVKGQKSTTDVERIVSCEAKKAAAELRSDFERLQSSFGSRILDDHSLRGLLGL